MTDDFTDIADLGADALSRAIHTRRVSCREVMQATLNRVHRLNPTLNALVSLAPDDRLLQQADAMDAELAQGASRGWLHGIPQAIKDTASTAGFPTTLGCTLLRHNLAAQDGLMAARMKAAGAIVIGKTNVPELGLGSHTFNRVFGATPNAWDPAVSAGGSSGGAAVALAQRLLPVADGSDFMGSLRNPAAWNHVFGLRPSQGRVPPWPAADVWVAQLATEGPMGRSVRDVAKLLAVQSGHDPRQPLSLVTGAGEFPVRNDTRALRALRIGWLGDLGGHLAMEDGLLPLCEQALRRCADAGAFVEAATPTFDPTTVWQAWLSWRRALMATRVAALLPLPDARRELKPEALWEHDQAQGTTLMDFMQASAQRSAFHGQLLTMFERFDVLALPVTQCWPFPVGERWPQRIGTRAIDTYHRWMESTIYATFGGLPAISLPAGFHANGRWPAGVQFIGRPQGDAALLQVAAAYESTVSELLARRPDEPASA